MKTVVGMFDNMNEAQRSFEELMKFGVSANDISVISKKPGNGLRLSAVEVSDTGPLAARGPITTMLTHERRGLASTLQGAGVSPSLAEHYVAAVQNGETLEFVIVEDRNAERVVEIMRRHAARYGGTDAPKETTGIQAGATGTSKAGPSGAVERVKDAISDRTGKEGQAQATDGDRYIPILREELHVGKREVDRGGVHLGVHVTERPVTEHVRLREEHIEIERRPVDRAARPDEDFRSGELDLIEHGEEAVVSKQVRVVEEVRVHKAIAERDETITDKLRNTEIDVDQPRSK